MSAGPGETRPRWDLSSRRGRVLFAVLAAQLLPAGVLAWCMAFPARWDGPGFVGAIGLSFPLHFLLPTLVALAVWWAALRRGARLSAWTAGVGALLNAVMALVPAAAVWARAPEFGVPLSLGEYLVHGARLNLGGPRPELSVIYGTARDGTPLELDVWRSGQPAEGPPRPAVVMIHGGAWTHGTRGLHPDWNRWLNGLGYEVFDVEYRLPPPARWLAEIGDVKAALGWVAAHAAEYHVDPARISVMGGSAGGNLALLAAYSRGDPRLPPSTDVPAVAVRSVVNLYGLSDLDLLYRTCESAGYMRPLLEQYVGGAPGDCPERYALLSPLTHVGAGSPPTLTLLGTSDRLVSVEQALVLDAALRGAGAPHELWLLPATDHAFDLNWGGFATQIARAKIAAFLSR